MKYSLGPELVRRSLDAHSSIGLVVGVFMYLICLTGTLTVLAEGFERWEQPDIPELYEIEPSAVANAVAQYRQRMSSPPESLWVVLPEKTLPRVHIADAEQEWWLDENGNYQAPVRKGWTHMLKALHIHLHMPETLGFFLVSSGGAMLIALIISGLFAHPRLFRDAFRFRRGGARRLEQADLHNRLSVWALPFHLMIAITGAFYGLVGLLAIVTANLFYDGNPNTVFDEVFGADPELQAPIMAADPAAAMRNLADIAPEASPIYLVIHKMDTRGQFVEIAATQPGRLAYSEIYRFDSAGDYIGSQALTSGPFGRQFLYSLYRIHFGWFGGHLTRISWVVLGLALTVVSVTGVNIWLARRGRMDWIDHVWAGFVWGVPLALGGSALMTLAIRVPPLAAFLVLLVCTVGYSAWRRNTHAIAGNLQHLCGFVVIALAAWHTVVMEATHIDLVSSLINSALVVTGAVLLILGRGNLKTARASRLGRAA